jgi:hypothetical protein
MATTTPVLGLTKPTVGADDDSWGNMWNQNADVLDTKVLTTKGVNLPTSSVGLQPGDLWINGGFLCVVQ